MMTEPSYAICTLSELMPMKETMLFAHPSQVLLHTLSHTSAPCVHIQTPQVSSETQHRLRVQDKG